MPYLKITCPVLEPAKYAAVAAELTDVVNELFYNPKARLTREDLRERTTVHFTPYRQDEIYIGARTPAQRGHFDITIELSDWYMSVKQQRKTASRMTAVIAKLFDIPSNHEDNINLRFHSYPPTDFAVGGKLLSDLIPFIGRAAKRIFG